MKKSFRLLTLVMALILCAAVFASCGETGKTTTTTQAQAQDTTPTGPSFPTADYNGETFTVYVREASTYTHAGIYAEEQDGDIINDQTLKRNQAVEAKYNMKFAIKTADNPSSKIEADLQSDSVDYDLILDRRSYLASKITTGALADWSTLGIDMTTEWWDENAKTGYGIGDKFYLAVNDVSYANLSGARFLYFGKQVVSDYNLTSPYDLVANNQWTLDKFCELVKQVSNTQTEGLGVYGMLRETGSSNGNHMHLMTGCGVTFVRNADGKLVSNIDDSFISKLQDITDKLKTVLTKDYTLTYDEVDKLDTQKGDLSKWDNGRRNFAEGHFLFVQSGMGVANMFKDMKEGFGVVPNPKYTTDQERYYHKIDRYSLIWAIPNAASVNKDRIAVITDYWAYESTDTVMSAFYEVVTKSKNVDESTAQANLDTIKATIAYEVGDLFEFGITSAINDGYEAGSMSRKFSTNAIKAINNVIEKVNTQIAALSN